MDVLCEGRRMRKDFKRKETGRETQGDRKERSQKRVMRWE